MTTESTFAETPHTFERECLDCGAFTELRRVGNELREPGPIEHHPNCPLGAALAAMYETLGVTAETVAIVNRLASSHLVFQMTERTPGQQPVKVAIGGYLRRSR
jgi:hypothetical protein